MVGQIMRFVLPCLVAREILERGDLGKPVTGSSALLKTWMESNRRGWHLDPETGGGMLMTAGIHALDQLIWLMDGRVSSISAAAGASFHDQKADDSAMMLLRFADGRFGQVASIGYRDGGGAFDMELVCENGTLRIDPIAALPSGGVASGPTSPIPAIRSGCRTPSSGNGRRCWRPSMTMRRCRSPATTAGISSRASKPP